jgi:gentisate 1,2-dioxygenase
LYLMEKTQTTSSINYWEELFRLRDIDRANKKNAITTVIGDDLPWELNRQGFMRWYLNPVMEDRVINPFIFYVQNIPPGSRSGRVKTQGSQVFYIWEGKGYTSLNGVRHNWEEGACVQLPLIPTGAIFQHFNTDPEKNAVLVSVEANTEGALGMDRGSGFEQLENCPEYEKEMRKG